MPIHVGDLVRKSSGHSDVGQLGIVVEVELNSTQVMIVRVITDIGERNWYGEYVEVISLPSAST